MGSRGLLARGLVPLAVVWMAVASASAKSTGPGLYTRTQQAAVEVLVDGHLSGSGFFVDSSGLVMTACHVIWGHHKRLEIRSSVVGRLRVRRVGVDRGHDAALLRARPREGGYPALELAERPPPAPSDVYVYGAPMYRHDVLLHGKIARNDSTFEYLADVGYYVEVIHLSAPTPPGTSGGPWLGLDGRVVGLQTGLMRNGSAPVGVGYMVPVQPLRALIRLGHDADTADADTAVEELWEQDSAFVGRFPPGTEGLVLRQVESGGVAAKAGLREWDLVVAVDGRPVALRDAFMRALRAHKSAEKITFRVLPPDGGRPRDVKVTLERLEKER